MYLFVICMLCITDYSISRSIQGAEAMDALNDTSAQGCLCHTLSYRSDFTSEQTLE